MKSRFQLKPGQIRGRIDIIKLTFLCLRKKRTQIAITLHAKQLKLEQTKPFNKISFSLKPINVCILPMVFNEFAKSRAMRAMRAYVPKAFQHFIFTCQRANLPKTCHFSNWRANEPKACQHFIFTCQRAKNVPFFKLAGQRTKRHANFSTIFQKKKCFNYG